MTPNIKRLYTFGVTIYDTIYHNVYDDSILLIIQSELMNRNKGEEIICDINWGAIKENIWATNDVERIFIDDGKKAFGIKMGGVNILLGYYHVEVEQHDKYIKAKNSEQQLLTDLAAYADNIQKLISKYNWKQCKCMIVTAYKLSNYRGLDYNILPQHADYLYINNYANPILCFLNFEIKPDQGIVDFKNRQKEVDALFTYLHATNKEQTSRSEFWTCSICDGDNETGCLYFDPTECPKFT